MFWRRVRSIGMHNPRLKFMSLHERGSSIYSNILIQEFYTIILKPFPSTLHINSPSIQPTLYSIIDFTRINQKSNTTARLHTVACGAYKFDEIRKLCVACILFTYLQKHRCNSIRYHFPSFHIFILFIIFIT